MRGKKSTHTLVCRACSRNPDISTRISRRRRKIEKRKKQTYWEDFIIFCSPLFCTDKIWMLISKNVAHPTIIGFSFSFIILVFHLFFFYLLLSTHSSQAYRDFVGSSLCRLQTERLLDNVAIKKKASFKKVKRENGNKRERVCVFLLIGFNPLGLLGFKGIHLVNAC